MLEDRLLLWKIKDGDEDALRQVYEKYKDDILTIARSMVCEQNEAEDILHDVFISFARAARHFRFYQSLKGCLLTSTVNKITDGFRKKMYQMVELERPGRIESDSQAPQIPATADEESEILCNALAQIPLRQRQVIILHLQADLKFAQIARIQNIPTNTVRARYYYGIERLSSILDRTMTE